MGWVIHSPRPGEQLVCSPDGPGCIQRDILHLEGTTLTAVRFEPFRVDLWFLGDFSILLTLQKPFRCSLDPHLFDPTSEHPDGVHAAFIQLRGRKCSSVTLTESRLRLTFETDSSIEMDLQVDDFEPFHLSGYTTSPPEECLFFYVDPQR